MARVEADPDPLVAAGEVDQLAQLLERAAEGVSGAGGVLEQEPAVVGLGQRVLHHLGHARQRLVLRLADGRAGWSTTPSALISSPMRSAWINESADFFASPGPSWRGLMR